MSLAYYPYTIRASGVVLTYNDVDKDLNIGVATIYHGFSRVILPKLLTT